MRKRPSNSSDEYEQIKRAYPKIDEMFMSDSNLTCIDCSVGVRHRLQQECSLRSKQSTIEDKIHKVRLFMIQYLKFENRKHYDALNSYCNKTGTYFSSWIVKAHKIAYYEIIYLESLYINERKEELYILNEWYGKSFVENCREFQKKLKTASPQFLSENPYVAIISKAKILTNPYATILKYKRHLRGIPNKFIWVDTLALALSWVQRYDEIRWKESILYIINEYLENKDKNTDGATALSYESLMENNLIQLEEENNFKNQEFNWDMLEVLISERRLFACKSSNSMYITSMKWHKWETATHDLLANNVEDYRKDESKKQMKAAVRRQKYPQNKKPTAEQEQSVENSIRFRYSMLSSGAGTGKTDYHLKLSVNALQKLEFTIVIAVPTHAAKKPIMREMKATKRGIHTLKYLTYFKRGQLNSRIMTVLSQNTKIAIFVDEMAMTDTETFGDLCHQISLIAEEKPNMVTKLIMIGDHKQCPAVGNGCPFDDIYFANYGYPVHESNIPVVTYTKQFRAKHNDLHDYAQYFLPEAEVKHYILDDSFTGKYEKVNFDYTYDIQNDTNFSEKLRELCSYLKSQGILQDSIFQMSPTNRVVFEAAEIIRSVFHPIDHEKRYEYVGQNQNKHKCSRFFAPNDKVFMDENSQFYKRGDESVVINVDHKGPLLELELDYKDHKFLQKVIHLREEEDPKKDYYHDVPYEITFLRSIKKSDFKNVDIWKPTFGFTDIDEELFENNCHESDDESWENFASKQERVEAIRKSYKYHIRVDPFDVKPLSCITTYKAQGGQKEICVCIQKLSPDNQKMTSKQMYTQITRAQEFLYCIGPKHCFTHEYILRPVARRCTYLSCMYNDTTDTLQNAQIKRYAQNRIPYFIRECVWNKYAGHNSSKGNCYVCGCQVDIRKWHCAHIVAAANGGALSPENLVISCEFCNCSAGTQNFEEFKKKYQEKQKKIIEDNISAYEDVVSEIRANLKYGTNNINKMIKKKFGENGMRIVDLMIKSGRLTKIQKPLINESRYYEAYCLKE